MPVQPIDVFELSGLVPLGRRTWRTLPMRVQPGLTNLPKGAVLGESTLSQNAVHTLAALSATSGTFTLSFRGQTTTTLNYNDTAATIATALNALSTIGAAGVVGTGNAPNNAASGSVLTWSGANFAKMPVELPTINVLTTFDVQPTIVSTTVGYSAGVVVPYIASGSNGTGTPKYLSQYTMSTDSAGNITFGQAPGIGQFGSQFKTAPCYSQGDFRIEDLPIAAIAGITGGFLDAAGAATLGKVVEGTVASGIGILRLT